MPLWTGAVGGSMIDITLHSLLDLVLVNTVRDVRARHALGGELHLHIAAPLTRLPQLRHVGVEPARAVRDDERPVVLVAVAPDTGATRDLQGHVSSDPIEV